MTQPREMAVAGSFYPAEAANLSRTVHEFLDGCASDGAAPPKALIVPHAGYVYSGPVAATAYARLRPYREQYSRVVLLGPSHRVPVQGLATSSAPAFRTPLGDIPLDREILKTTDQPDLTISDQAHRFEHSLEVQLPFLQVVLGSFSLLPIVAGDCRPETVASVMDAFWGGPETLIVVSSDLSHYLTPQLARVRDRATCEAIEQFDERSISYHDACGAIPVAGLLIAARRHSLRVRTLDLRNSGDTAGSGGEVVGYGAWEFYSG